VAALSSKLCHLKDKIVTTITATMSQSLELGRKVKKTGKYEGKAEKGKDKETLRNY
jgi:hypothetical protein